jgi:sec-independent protein translocase protein TatA
LAVAAGALMAGRLFSIVIVQTMPDLGGHAIAALPTYGLFTTFRCRAARLPPARYPRHMPNVGPLEIIGLLLLALLLFGAKRLPEIGRSLGRGMREFKDSVSGKDDDDKPELTQSTTSAEAPPPQQQPREHDTVP